MQKGLYLPIAISIIVSVFIFSPPPVSAHTYPDGTILRLEGDFKIYVVFHNQRRWIKNIDVFKSYGHKWENISVIPPVYIEDMPMNNLVRQEGDFKVYAINDAGYKRHIASPEVFNSYGFRWEDIATVSKEEMDNYEVSYLVREVNDPRVYYLEDNKKRWVDSVESFYIHGFDWGSIHVINKKDVDFYAGGEIVTPASAIERPSGTIPATPAIPAVPKEKPAIPAQPATSTAPLIPSATSTIPAVPPTATSTTPVAPPTSTTSTEPGITPAPAPQPVPTPTPAPTSSTTTSNGTPTPTPTPVPHPASLAPTRTQKWAFSITEGTIASPALATDGTIYISALYNNKLYAINPDGTQKWVYGKGGGSLAVGADGTIYVVAGKLYAINPNGTLKWSAANTSNDANATNPAIGSDGTIYYGTGFGDGKFYAINSDGTLKWAIDLAGAIFSPSVATNGTIYVGSSDKKLFALNPNGTKKWEFVANDSVKEAPAIGSDGTIYFQAGLGKLYAINSDGTKKWEFATDASSPIGGGTGSSPSIGPDGTIYIGGGHTKKVYAVNPDGTQKWAFTTGGSIVHSAAAVGKDGTIYIGSGSGDGRLYALSENNGSLLWSFATSEALIEASPALALDGMVYIGNYSNSGGKLYAVNSDSLGMASSAWPKFAKDSRNTGSIQDSSIQNPVANTADTTPPTSPPVFSLDSVSSTKITISWSGAYDNTAVTGYQIFRNDALLPNASTSPYTDTAVSSGVIYTYYIVAYDAAGNKSTPTSTRSAIPPGSGTTCNTLTLVLYKNQSVYQQGDTVTYGYSCSPGGSTSSVTIDVIKPDGSITRYNSASGSITKQILGFGTSNLLPGPHTIRACMPSKCVDLPFSIQ